MLAKRRMTSSVGLTGFTGGEPSGLAEASISARGACESGSTVAGVARSEAQAVSCFRIVVVSMGAAFPGRGL